MIRRSRLLSSKKKELAPIVSNFLFHDESASVAEKKDYVQLKIKIREELKQPEFRNILAEILTELQKDVSGDTRKRLNHLYCELELHLDAFEKLKSRRWQVVSKGILELTQMQVYDAYPFITKFLNNKRSVIRKQAEIATVSLRSEGISHFLDTTTFAISEWQQLKIMEVLRTKERFMPPNFKTWLISTNRDVVLFALRLIKHYNQNDAISSIVELLKHKDDHIKVEAIYCIKEFCVISALPTLKAIYETTSQNVKLELLDAIATLGSEDDLHFLEKIQQSKTSFTIKNKAAMTINDIVPDSVLPTKDIIPESKLNYEPKEVSAFGDTEALDAELQKIAGSRPEKKEPAIKIDATEEIEVFEIDENTISVSEAKNTKNSGDTTKKKAKEKSTAYEIGELSEEINQSVNEEIGLVSNSPAIDNHSNNEKRENCYIHMSDDEKEAYISALEIEFFEEDIPLLEGLMENETDSELRFRIFKMLKSNPLEKEGSEKLEVPEAEEKHSVTDDFSVRASIFYDLFHYASDLDSKCILIRQMADVGDEKELPLLQFLANNETGAIKSSAEKALDAVLQKNSKANANEAVEVTVPSRKEDESAKKIYESQKVASEIENELLPMELCFLYDEFGIIPPKDEEDSLGINFELAEEFYTAQNHRDH